MAIGRLCQMIFILNKWILIHPASSFESRMFTVLVILKGLLSGDFEHDSKFQIPKVIIRLSHLNCKELSLELTIVKS
jgi:hypothetical protein